MKLLRASLYADALVMYTRCKAGLRVSIPPLAATAVNFPVKNTYDHMLGQKSKSPSQTHLLKAVVANRNQKNNGRETKNKRKVEEGYKSLKSLELQKKKARTENSTQC